MYRKLLIVDDDEDDIRMLTDAFRQQNLPVRYETLNCSRKLLDTLMASPPDALPALLLIDLNMPAITGIEALAAIRGHALTANLPVCVMSTSGDPATMQQCYNYGIRKYLVKPTRYEGLLKVAREICSILNGV